METIIFNMATLTKPTSIDTPTGRVYQGGSNAPIKLEKIEQQGIDLIEVQTVAQAEMELRSLSRDEAVIIHMSKNKARYEGNARLDENPKVYFTSE
jgi:hypothetical protein